MNLSADTRVFQKSRRRIIAAIMAVLALLFVGTLVTIYGVSYKELQNRDQRMLESFIDNYQLKITEDVSVLPYGLKFGPGSGKSDFKDDRAFKATNFYAVVLLPDYSILEIDTHNGIGNEENLAQLAYEVLNTGRTEGVASNLVYRVGERDGLIVVAFMDGALMDASTATLLRNTLIFGVLFLAVLFFVAREIARRIVAPMEQAWSAQRQFISDASHELKTPLAVASTNADVLQREIGSNQWLDNINYELSSMSDLVSAMMDLSFAEYKSSAKDNVDLSHIVEKESLPFETIAFEEGRDLQIDVQPGLMVFANGQSLAQLIRLLLDNALSHGVADAPVQLCLKQNNKWALLKVINGVTQAAADGLSRGGTQGIFDRFTRQDEARTKDDSKHLGLGLSIAKAIVLSAGGTINASVDIKDNACELATFTIEIAIPLA